MKKKIIYGLLLAVAMVTASSSFVSCKDYEGDDYSELKEENLSLAEALRLQNEAMQNYLLKSDYHPCDCDSTAQYKWIKAIEANVNALKNDSVSKYAKLIHENNKLITAIGDTLHQFVFAWGDNLTEALETAGKAVNITKTWQADSTRWEKADSVAKRANAVADSAWNWIKSGKDASELEFENLAALVKDYRDADKALEDQIDDLKADVANILGTLKKQITGIHVDATYNPVFGTLAVPFNIQTNVLATFIGEAGADVKFPTTDASKYVGGEYSWLTTQEFAAIRDNGGLPAQLTLGAGDPLISDAEDNAGRLYLTVNPTNIDFEGTEFTLRTTDNKVCDVELTPLKPSTERLNFGYTRAAIESASDNGFYEMKAKIRQDNAENFLPNYDLKSIASAVKTTISDAKDAVVNGGSKRLVVNDIANVVAKAYASAPDVLPRYGVQAEWVDTFGVRKYTSEYNVAVTAIKPMGFDVFKNLDGYGTWTSPYHVKYIDGRAVDQEIWDMLSESIKLELHLNLPTLSQLNLSLNPGSLYWFELETLISEDYAIRYKGADGDLIGYMTDAGATYIYSSYYSNYFGADVVQRNDGGLYYWSYDPTVDTTGDFLPIYLSVNGGYIQATTSNIQGSGKVWVNLEPFVTKLFSEFNSQFNTSLAPFNAAINQFNGLDAQLESQIAAAIEQMGKNMAVSVSDLANDYISDVNKWIRRLNNGIDYAYKALNRVDRLLQPVLLSFSDTHSLAQISRFQYAPSTLSLAKGNTVYVQPTTWTLETVAPAYKKHVAVSNVFKDGKSAVGGDADLKAAMKKANEAIGSNKLLDGVHAYTVFQADDTMKGMTFEIVYTALGYNGVISGTKAYIKVTE